MSGLEIDDAYLNMKKFTRFESISIIVIFICLFAVVGYNMSISLRRGRDSVRKDDLSSLQKSLDTYYQKYRSFPASSDNGEIIGCFNEKPIQNKKTGLVTNAVVCKWGESKFENSNFMPRDPKYKEGASYIYKSTGKSYELYISLEGKDEAEYTESIVNKNLHCGTKICNYGRVN